MTLEHFHYSVYLSDLFICSVILIIFCIFCCLALENMITVDTFCFFKKRRKQTTKNHFDIPEGATLIKCEIGFSAEP